MKFICDAPDGATWFRIETDGEAAQESALMQHAVEKHFLREKAAAEKAFKPTSASYFEGNIGLEAHIQRTMPLFLTLRDGDGDALVTAMLPPGGQEVDGFRMIIVGPKNGDPYPANDGAIEALGAHFGLTLDRASCFPYQRDSGGAP